MTLREELDELSNRPEFLPLTYDMIRIILIQAIQKNPDIRRHELNGALKDEVKSELIINDIDVYTERMIGYENTARTILSW